MHGRTTLYEIVRTYWIEDENVQH